MKLPKLLFIVALLIVFSTGYAQDSTLIEKNLKILSAIPGNTKMVLTGVAWFGFQSTFNDPVKTDVTNSFNSYGFSPMFLWKLSDKMFFESEIEINNGAMELEFAKLSFSLNKYMTIGAGRMLTPFGAYGERWEPIHIERFPNSHLLPDDNLLPDDTHLYYGAIMGVDIRGGIPLGSSKMNYSLYVSNGPLLSKDENGNPTGVIQYENLLDENNNNKEVGGRIGILPFSNSSLEIGFSEKHGIAGDRGNPVYGKTGATAYAVDLSYVKSIDAIKSTINIRGQFNSLKVDKANYYLTDSTNYTFDNTMQNYFVQFSLRPSMSRNKYLKKTELLFRYNALTPPKDALWGAKDNNGNGGTITRMDVGLDYWLSWKTGLRFAYESTAFPNGTKAKEFLASLVYGF